ncbi:MAG: hypothetical protein PG978_001128 [Wolbachia endosymbiont of Ctenocephalides felis wCfeF]|nr:MAG: hypothetical protein PG978_001128 [Wolbachia endosymbiont of Ctenocephalides felis wCfeF]
MPQYEDLTERQKKLYNTLKDAIENKKKITPILEEIKKEGVLKEVLTTANIIQEFSSGSKWTFTPLGYAIDTKNQEGTRAILDVAEKDKEVLKVVLTTANLIVKLSGHSEDIFTPLGYAIDTKNQEGTRAILDVAEKDKEVLKVVLTTANITKKLSGHSEDIFTPLGYAIDTKNQEGTRAILDVAEKDKEVLKVVLTTANITKKLKDGTEYNLTPLGYAIDTKNQEGTRAILDVAEKDKEVLKVVLTTANITKKLKDGTEYNLTPLDYAIYCNNREKKVKAILDVAEKDKGILNEVFVGIEFGRKELQKILETLKNQEQNEKQKTKIDDWLEILAKSVPSYEDNEKPLAPESSISNNKSILIGSVCGVIAALAVSGGCFAAGVTLPISAIIGIALAAGLVVGFAAGIITECASSKPRDELDKPDLKAATRQVDLKAC